MKENLPDSHTIPFNVTKELVDEVDAIMQKRGYSLMSSSAEGKQRSYFSDKGIHADVRIHTTKHIDMCISFTWKLFVVKTGPFDFHHQQLRKWFECPLLKIKRKIEEITL